MHVVNVTESKSPRETPLPIYAYKKSLQCSAAEAEVSGQRNNAGSRTEAGSTVQIKSSVGPQRSGIRVTVVPQSVVVEYDNRSS